MAQIFLSFILLSVIGTLIALYYQHKYWERQQRFLGQEKEYIALKDFYPEISSAIGSRLYKTKRLNWALDSKDKDLVEAALAAYDADLVKWNENLGRFYASLTIYLNHEYTGKLESVIHQGFQRIGVLLESDVRSRRQGNLRSIQNAKDVEKMLRRLDAAVSQFNRNVLRSIDEKRMAVYFGRRLVYTEENISKYSNVELVKALFISDVDSYAVACSPSDSRFPRLPFFKWPWIY